MKNKLIALAKNLAATSPLNVLSMWVALLFVSLDELATERDEALARVAAAERLRDQWFGKWVVLRSEYREVYALGWKALVQRDEQKHLLTLALRQRDEQRTRADSEQSERVTSEYARDAAEKLAELEAEDDDDPPSVTAEVEAWGKDFEAAAVPMSSVTARRSPAQFHANHHEENCAACGVKRELGRAIESEGLRYAVCQTCFKAPWCDTYESIQDYAAKIQSEAQIEHESPPCANAATAAQVPS